MIEVDNLQFQYPGETFRLEIQALRITAGESVAIIGPSGSGKTTLLQLLAGILRPQQGEITVADNRLNHQSEAERRRFRLHQIGIVFQEFELLDHLTALQNILLPCRLSGHAQVTTERRQRAVGLAESMGIANLQRRFPRMLSQGERQRAALCRALLFQPPLLLCDEPTGNLDPINAANMLDVLCGYVAQHDTTLVAVTHDHSILDRFSRTIDFADFPSTSVAGV